MDLHTFKAAAKKLPAEDSKWLGAITNLCRYTDSKMAEFVEDNDGRCWLCDCANGSLEHMLWDCPKLDHVRNDGDFKAEQLKRHLPPSLLIGIPPAMTADECDSFWKVEDMRLNPPPWWAMLPGNWKINSNAKSLLENRSEEDRKLNARQLIAKLKATRDEGMPADPTMPRRNLTYSMTAL